MSHVRNREIIKEYLGVPEVILKFLPSVMGTGALPIEIQKYWSVNKFFKIVSSVLTTELWVIPVEKSRRQLNT